MKDQNVMFSYISYPKTKTPMEKQFSFVKNQTFLFAQIFPNNIANTEIIFAYTEWVSAFMQERFLHLQN